MLSFKKWFAENITTPNPAKTMGQPVGPKPLQQDKVATGLVNKDMAKNPNFLPQIAGARDSKQQLGMIAQQAAGIIKQNSSPIKAAGIQPDLLNQKIGDIAGLDVKRMFLRK